MNNDCMTALELRDAARALHRRLKLSPKARVGFSTSTDDLDAVCLGVYLDGVGGKVKPRHFSAATFREAIALAETGMAEASRTFSDAHDVLAAQHEANIIHFAFLAKAIEAGDKRVELMNRIKDITALTRIALKQARGE